MIELSGEGQKNIWRYHDNLLPCHFGKGDTSYGSYVPDVPGCIAVGDTPEETLKLLQEALQEHLELLQRDGDIIPNPSPVSAIAYDHATEAVYHVDVELPCEGEKRAI
jgi:predicted RNase H-like HicB family nuclease